MNDSDKITLTFKDLVKIIKESKSELNYYFNEATRKPKIRELVDQQNLPPVPTTYYCDMDGVLADFFIVPDAAKHVFDEDFFFNLEPIKENVDEFRKAIRDGKDCYILSATPGEEQDEQKRRWLHKYIPELDDDHIIFSRGPNKKTLMKTETGILIDDNIKCIKSWLMKPGNVAKQCLGSIKGFFD